MKLFERLVPQAPKERYVPKKTLRDCIPADRIWDDGMMLGADRYSVSYSFSDINYLTLGEKEQEDIFMAYCSLINSLDPEARTKLTLWSRPGGEGELKDTVFLPSSNDGLAEYRKAYNEAVRNMCGGTLGTIRKKYLTVSVPAEDPDAARLYFARAGTGLKSSFEALGSECAALGAAERLSVLYSMYRGEKEPFVPDIKSMRTLGHDFADWISPDGLEIHDDHLVLGGRYARVLYLKNYASFIRDTLVSELCSSGWEVILTVDMVPVPFDKAVREAESRLLGVETNITNWQRRQNRANNYSAAVPFDLELQRRESKEFLDDLKTRDQRMLCCNVLLAHFADTKEDLDSDTEAVKTCAARHLCQMSVLRYRQLEGFSDVLPIGTVAPGVDRTLTTESLAVFIPFGTKEMIHGGGICYGTNRKSGSAIVIDRGRLLNGNSFILGVSGSGKSFMAKNEIAALVLGGGADVIVIDPEREYVPLVKALNGEVVEISSSGKSHINAMDINRSYGDGGDPIAMKSEFLLSLCEQFAGNMSLGPKEKSVIDRCARNVYRTGGTSGIYTPPTLREFREELLRQEEPEAAEVALAIELFTDGSLSVFAQKTNVDTENRFLCYDISGLGEQLKSAGMLVILDSIFNRITANRAAGKKTYIFIDEIYLLFGHEYSAVFLETLWKRVRKYGAFCTGITQNVDDLMQSVTARTMLANSELVTMLDQAPTDRMQLAELMNISQTELPYITNVKAGSGLLKVGESLLPFECSFPTDNALYRLMTTKSGETV